MNVAPTPDRILRIKTVLGRNGLGRATLYRKIGAGKFPAQIRIADRCCGWRKSSVNDWLRNPLFWTAADG